MEFKRRPTFRNPYISAENLTQKTEARNSWDPGNQVSNFQNPGPGSGWWPNLHSTTPIYNGGVLLAKVNFDLLINCNWTMASFIPQVPRRVWWWHLTFFACSDAPSSLTSSSAQSACLETFKSIRTFSKWLVRWPWIQLGWTIPVPVQERDLDHGGSSWDWTTQTLDEATSYRCSNFRLKPETPSTSTLPSFTPSTRTSLLKCVIYLVAIFMAALRPHTQCTDL